MSTPSLDALPVATRLCLEAAGRLGLESEILDPEYGYLYELRGRGRRHSFLGGRSPLNDSVAARLAEDKHYSGVLLSRAGLRGPRTARCLSRRHPSLVAYRDRAGMAPALGLAEALGYPLVVKPNRLSHGRGVAQVADLTELRAAIRTAWALDSIALVQECVEGRDFRLDFLDGEFLAGYERHPIRVRGDGKQKISELLAAEDARYADRSRCERLAEDPRFSARLAQRGWTLSTVLPEGAQLAFDGQIQNLHAASTARLIKRVPEALRAACVRAGEAVGLRHFGVDLKAPDLEADPSEVVFIEINASPLLSQIYLLGHREEALGAQTRVLEAIFGAA